MRLPKKVKVRFEGGPYGGLSMRRTPGTPTVVFRMYGYHGYYDHNNNWKSLSKD